MRSTTTAIILAFLSTGSHGFSPTPQSSRTHNFLEMAKGGKGFGSTPPPSPPKKKAPEKIQATQAAAPAEEEAVEFNPFDAAAQTPTDTSRGKIALEKMRREKAEQRNAELQKMKEVVQQDQLVRESGGEAAVIPEKVAQRMGKRMLPFVGIPLFGSMAAFVGFWYMATYRDMEFQPVLVAGTTIALLATGLIGITYSMMSASWDPERDGSVLGTDEFSRNIDNIKEGLGRSRDNAQVREQMMLEENFALRQKQAKEKKPAPSSLIEKMGEELD